jgi:protein-S-isoprenylcysteine O-methyltransferase Ste14
MFGRVVGQRWVVLGAALNSLWLFEITRLTERKIKAKSAERAAAYREYAKATSMWIPMSPAEEKSQ